MLLKLRWTFVAWCCPKILVRAWASLLCRLSISASQWPTGIWGNPEI